MNRTLGIGLFAAGAVVSFFAYQSYQSLSSKTVELVGGAPNQQTMILAGVGVGLLVVGLVMTLRGR